MSEKKGGNVDKRFFVQGTQDLFKELKLLAIELDERGVEVLAGKLLLEIVAQKRAQINAAKGKRK